MCCNFQILNSNYDNALSTLIGTTGDKDRDKCYKFLLETATYYNTTQTLAQLAQFLPTVNTKKLSETNAKSSIPPRTTAKDNYQSNKDISLVHKDTLYGGLTYNKTSNTSSSSTEKFPTDQMKAANKAYTKAAETILQNWTFTNMNHSDNTDLAGLNYYDYYTGMFSSIFLADGRSNPEVKGSYTDISYNPLVDEGIGNMIWIDWISKSDSEYSPVKSKCLLRDLPLWAMVHGYCDYCLKVTGHSSLFSEARVVIRCPYTYPQLLRHSNPNWGFVD